MHCEFWQWKGRGAVQNLSECADEFCDRRWIWRHNVHRSSYSIVVQPEDKRPDDILQRNPAPPLTAAPDATSQSQTEREQQRRKRPPILCQHHADAHVPDSQTGLASRFRRLLPGNTSLGQKTTSGSA